MNKINAIFANTTLNNIIILYDKTLRNNQISIKTASITFNLFTTLLVFSRFDFHVKFIHIFQTINFSAMLMTILRSYASNSLGKL